MMCSPALPGVCFQRMAKQHPDRLNASETKLNLEQRNISLAEALR